MSPDGCQEAFGERKSRRKTSVWRWCILMRAVLISATSPTSGDRVIGKGRLPTNNRLNVVLRMAASTLRQSDSYLGAQFRRLKRRRGSVARVS